MNEEIMMKKLIATMVLGYILILLSGCTSMTVNQRDAMIADIRAAKRATLQSAQELNKIIEVKDRDIKKFAPAYAQVNGRSTEDLTATISVSEQVTSKANSYIQDLYRASTILEDLESDLGSQ